MDSQEKGALNRAKEEGKRQAKKQAQKYIKKALLAAIKAFLLAFGKYIVIILAVFTITASIVDFLNGDSASANSINDGTYETVGDGDFIVDITKSAPEIVIKDAETLKKAFGGYSGSSELIKYADAFLQYQNKYNVNAVFAAAVSITETGAGRAGHAVDGKKNWFNIECHCGNSSHGRFENYSNPTESIEKFFNLIANGSYYFAKGNYTVRDIGLAGYCENPEDVWIPNTIAYMTKMFSNAGITISAKTEISEKSESLLQASDKVTKYVIDNGYTYQATDNVDYTFPIQNSGKKTLSCSSFVQQCLLEVGYKQCEGREKLWARKDKSLSIKDFKNNLGIDVELIDDLTKLAPGDILQFGTGYHIVIVYSINGDQITVKGMPEAANQGMSGKTHKLNQLQSKKCYGLRIK